MELEKLQRFLRNKHKFDRKREDYEIVEDLKQKASILGNLIKKNETENLDVVVGRYILDLIKLSNEYDIDIVKTLKEKLNFGL